jgi:hypothetical protein
MNPGLHGITIAPKKNPYKNALIHGFFTMGARPFGKNFHISIFLSETSDMIPVMISTRLITNKMPKAMGEIISTMPVKDTSKIVVNMRPIKNINRITPDVTTSPSKKMVLRLIRSPVICEDR